MKLHYYKDPLGNFGDDLNPLIWYSLFPRLFHHESNQDVVLGIGTLINDLAPSAPRLHVLGSGVGYHRSAKVDARWNFEFVRGPNSCRALGLDESKAITDPAILIAKIFTKYQTEQRTRRVCYMPHHTSTHFADWREVCKAAELEYLDPADDVATTIYRIESSDFVIAEAMHAAIVADAMRVPWIAVKAYPHILDFKWVDWCSSVGLEYRPVNVESLWDMEQFSDRLGLIKSEVKHLLMGLGFSGRAWTPPIVRSNKHSAFPKVVEALLSIKTRGLEQMSKDGTHAELLERVEGKISEFSRRFADC